MKQQDMKRQQFKEAHITNTVQALMARAVDATIKRTGELPKLHMNFAKVPAGMEDMARAAEREGERVAVHGMQVEGEGNIIAHALMIKVFLDQNEELNKVVIALTALDHEPDNAAAARVILDILEQHSVL
jgi:hypothetical protein